MYWGDKLGGYKNDRFRMGKGIIERNWEKPMKGRESQYDNFMVFVLLLF